MKKTLGTMINRLRISSGKLLSLSAFVLIVSFLVLGSCAFKKAIYTFINNSPTTEYANIGQGKKLASALCAGVENSLIKKMTLPGRQADVVPTLATVIFIAFFTWWSFRSESAAFSFYKFLPAPPSPVPAYLRNRALLI